MNQPTPRTFSPPSKRENYDEVTARMEGKLFAPVPLRNAPEQRPAGDARTSFRFPNQRAGIDAGTIADLLERVADLENASSTLPFSATYDAAATTISVLGGGIYRVFVLDADLTVSAATSTAGQTHAWIKLIWSTSTFLPTSASIEFGTAWPTDKFSVSGGESIIPIAKVASGTLTQILTGNVLVHRVFVNGGIILYPASL